MRLPRLVAALLLGTLSVISTATLVPYLRFVAPGSPARHAPDLWPGIYMGWSSSDDARLMLYGAGCRDGLGDDAIVSLHLSGPKQDLLIPARDIDSMDLNTSGYGPVPVIAVEILGGETWSFDRAVLRCRSGKERATPLTVSVLSAHSNTADVTLETFRRYGSERLFGELLIHNHGEEFLQIRAISYAPQVRATGVVKAAVGSYAQRHLWRNILYDPSITSFDPSTITPWDPLFQHPDDPRRLLPRSADDLALEVSPGEMAAIYLEADSLKPGRGAVPVLAYPVTEIVTTSGPQQLLSRDPLFTYLPSR